MDSQSRDRKALKSRLANIGAIDLTDEQLQVILHPSGHHGRVLSVAGSGKTTTMAYRIEHLMKDRGVRRHQIQVLMFNHLARNQFMEKLDELGINRSQQPQVNTFHSYAYRVAKLMGCKQWFGDNEELGILELRRTIDRVVKRYRLDDDDIDLDEAKRAISLWKGALISPGRAGYSGQHSEAHISIYREFEERRLENNAITFDDFVPLAVGLIGSDKNLLAKHAGPLSFIIVDEYQDINLGQERLIELIASGGADVMVVGDDDQTIYEWRGARSEYILREFMTTFANKPHLTYHLTHSFRFGYSIAQVSYNAITHNTNRNEKILLAHDPTADSQITVVSATEPGGHANHYLANEIISLVKHKNVAPANIKVLGRTFAQLNSLSTEFLLRTIPFKVEGRAPFINAGECQVLLDYIRVASTLDKIPSDTLSNRFVNIANKPSRYLGRADLKRMLERGRSNNQSLRKLLFEATQVPTYFERDSQRENLEDLLSVLEEIGRKIGNGLNFPAGKLLDWIDQEIELQRHYENYYGDGESSFVRTQNISAIRRYAHHTALDWRKFIDHVENFDTTQGRPENTWIKMTTIHRTKGLEFDYVVVPDCQEGFMPVFAESEDPTYDNKDPKREPKAAEWIESERRLFYVCATRARKGLYVGTPAMTSATRQEQNNNGQPNMTSSRFLEECEFDPTLGIAQELLPAARHEEGHRLVEKCRSLASFHKIVTLVKEHYSSFFTDEVRRELAKVQLSNATRPFQYKQRYSGNSPKNRKSNDRNELDEEMWAWIQGQRSERTGNHRRR